MIKIYIPIPSGQIVPETVKKSIVSQNAPCIPVYCDTPPTGIHREGEMYSRELCRYRFLQSGDPVMVMMDCDIELLDTSVIQDMLDFLTKNPAWGACSANRSKYSSNRESFHTVIALTAIHRDAVQKISFIRRDFKVCPCLKFNNDIRAFGYLYGYFDTAERIREINK